ncbi:purine-nucleoside phosphorylase [Candidatus Neomarinimicrobiota bacterium]
MVQNIAEEAASYIQTRVSQVPRVAIVLGSGLSELADQLNNPIRISFDEIPHYPPPTVPGHVGELVFGTLSGVPVIVTRGRFHYYEGHSLDLVTLHVRVFAQLGAETVIITNAAGCTREEWNIGDLMLITGHLDYTFLEGPHDPVLTTGPPCYSDELLEVAREASRRIDLPLREGTYTWCLGPTFETPAEIREIQSLGGTAAGMSTVPEIRAAAEEGLKVLGVSCLTNYAAGIKDQPLNHAEVLEAGIRVKEIFSRFISEILVSLKD